MEKIRCVIADIPHIILADIVQQIAESRSGIEVVGRIENKRDLPQFVRDREVDVVILGMEADTLPHECKEMLDVAPELVIVGLVEDGRRVVVYIDDVGPKELVDSMKLTFNDKRSKE